MRLTLDRTNTLIDPCPACLPYIESDDTACNHCDKKPLHDDYFNKLAKLHITLDPSKTYIIHEGKVREAPYGGIIMIKSISKELLLGIDDLPEATQ
jgi:hypothetical protein